MTDTRKLVDRLQKILAMTNSPNVNEAANAAAMAAEFMLQHNLTESDVRSVADGGGENVTAFFLNAEGAGDWKIALAKKVAEWCDCAYLAWPKGGGLIQHILVGETPAIAGAIVMYEYLRDACFSIYERSADVIISFDDYASGFTSVIIQRISQIMRDPDKTSSEKNALVTAHRQIKQQQNDNFIVTNFMIDDEIDDDDKLPVRGSKGDHASFQAGVEDGKKVGLDKQVRSAKKERLQ